MAPESFIDDGIKAENADKSPGTEESGTTDEGTGEAPENEVVVSIAHEQGWRPKEQFRGNPDDWVDAATFIRRGGEIQHQRKRQVDELTRTVSELKEFNERVYKSEVSRLREELNAQRVERKSAIRESDVELVEELDNKIRDTETEIQKSERALAQKNDSSKTAPEFYTAWKAKNTWYGAADTDPEIQEVADAIAIKAKEDGLPLSAVLKRIDRTIAELYPDAIKGNAQDTRQARNVDSVLHPSRSSSAGRKNGFADLPREAQESCVRFEKAGGMSRADYVKNYFSSL